MGERPKKKRLQVKKKNDNLTKKERAELVVPVRDMIPLLAQHRQMTDEEFRRHADQVQPFGVEGWAYGRRKDLRHLEARGVKVIYVGPGPGPSMKRVYVRNGRAGYVRIYRHVVIPPAAVQRYAMRLNVNVKTEDRLRGDYERVEGEDAGSTLQILDDPYGPEEPYSDDPFIDELKDLDILDSVRAAPPDPTAKSIAVRGDNVSRSGLQSVARSTS